MDIPTWISVITGITSIVLAIVSMAVSFVFYKWGDESTKEMNSMSKSIKERTDYLGKLIDKMYDSTFTLVREESEAMRKHLFKTQDIGDSSQTEGDKSIDIVILLRDGKRTKDELRKELGLKETLLSSTLHRLCSCQLIYEEEGYYNLTSLKKPDNGIAQSTSNELK